MTDSEKHPSIDLSVLLPLFAAGFLVYGCNNIFMSVVPEYVQNIGMGEGFAGLQGSVFLFSAVALRFVLGPLADKYGTRPLLLLGTASYSVGGCLLLIAASPWQIIAARIVQSIGLAAFYPCATSTVVSTAPKGKDAAVLGAYRFVTSLSLLIGPYIAFWLRQSAGYIPSFAVPSAFALVALLLCFRVGTVAPKNCGRTPSPDKKPEVSNPLSLIATCLHGDPVRAAAVLGATFASAVGYGLLFSFGATWSQAVLPSTNPGLVFTLLGAGGLAVNAAIGCMGDRVDRRTSLVAALAATAAGLVLLGMADSDNLAFFATACVLCGIGYAGTVTAAIALAARGSSKLTSTLLSLQQNCIDLGIAVGSGVFGVLFQAIGGVCGWPFCLQGALLGVVAATVALTASRISVNN